MVKQIAKQPSSNSDARGRETSRATPRGGARLLGMLYNNCTDEGLRRVVVMAAAGVGRVRQMLHGRKAARSTVHDAGRCKGE